MSIAHNTLPLPTAPAAVAGMRIGGGLARSGGAGSMANTAAYPIDRSVTR